MINLTKHTRIKLPTPSPSPNPTSTAHVSPSLYKQLQLKSTSYSDWRNRLKDEDEIAESAEQIQDTRVQSSINENTSTEFRQSTFEATSFDATATGKSSSIAVATNKQADKLDEVALLCVLLTFCNLKLLTSDSVLLIFCNLVLLTFIIASR